MCTAYSPRSNYRRPPMATAPITLCRPAARPPFRPSSPRCTAGRTDGATLGPPRRPAATRVRPSTADKCPPGPPVGACAGGRRCACAHGRACAHAVGTRRAGDPDEEEAAACGRSAEATRPLGRAGGWRFLMDGALCVTRVYSSLRCSTFSAPAPMQARAPSGCSCHSLRVCQTRDVGSTRLWGEPAGGGGAGGGSESAPLRGTTQRG